MQIRAIKKMAIIVCVLGVTPFTNTFARELYPFNHLLPNDMESAPRIHGSEYDCKLRVRKDGKKNVYQAFVSGQFSDPTRHVSSVACFKTHEKCKAYLYFMRGYLQQVNSAACQKGYYTGLFNWD
ncbi:hypothetical protein [Polycladidibacter stylochi]|uniref:hypothetical protein n=1 Tax=Polycladidibacter stylochi TaxID=1807766 RepID=UPI000A960CB4|nr:hypothetical protein [Pseudovibrio stylochi]